MSIDGSSTEQTPEELAEEQAAFTAAFNKTDQVPAVETPEVPAEVVEEPPAEVEEVQEPADKPLTIDDLRALIEEQKQSNIQHTTKLSGQIGELKQRQVQLEAAKAKAAGISPKAREKLADQFPELAAMLFDDEAGPAEITAPAAAPVHTPANAEPDADAIEEAKALLTMDHPDWQTVTASPEYDAWLASLPAAVQKKVQTSYDPLFGSSMLTKFKAHQSASKPSPKPSKPKPSLEAAVTPRGVPRSAVAGPGTDDEETAAFKAAYKPKFVR